MPVLAVGYENGLIDILRVRGVENGFVLNKMNMEEFLQVQSENLKNVVSKKEETEH